MLAGKMKLNHFLMIAGAVSVVGFAGLYFACSNGDDVDEAKKRALVATDKARAEKKLPPPPPVQKTSPIPLSEEYGGVKSDESSPAETPGPREPAAETPSMREVDRALLGWAGKDLGSKKRKDVSKGLPYKINLYQDDGKSSVNRAKVDLDRDDKWDEKWTFDGTNVSRKVAPADDESYSESYVWNGKEWVKE